MRHAAILAFAVAILIGHGGPASGQQQACVASNFTKLPANTHWALGPTLKVILDANPQLWTVLRAARDAWDGTDAIDRIGDWNGVVSASNCPVGLPIQLGAMAFAVGACGAASAVNALAVDYLPNCAGCGTKSMVINTNVPWSFNPGPGQFDVQSVLTHEFGHMLGFDHQSYNVCTGLIGSGTCTLEPGKNTMVWNAIPGETCPRTLADWDVINANLAYP